MRSSQHTISAAANNDGTGAIALDGHTKVSVHAEWPATGTPVGELHLQARDIPGGTFANITAPDGVTDADYHKIAVSSSGNVRRQVDVYAREFRVAYARDSGTGEVALAVTRSK